jgi:hypothetical protein
VPDNAKMFTYVDHVAILARVTADENRCFNYTRR